MRNKAVVCRRAYLSSAPIMLVAAVLGMLALALDASHPASGQSWQLNNYCPQGARQVPYGGTYTCVCPDGSYATYGVPCRQVYQQPSGVQCNTGSYCPTGTACCGNQCCNAGSYCSRTGGCIPQGASDCGNGQFCRDGRSCWTSPVNVPGVLTRGELKCVTGDQLEALNAAVAQHRREEQQHKEAAEAERKRNEEERKEEARQKQEAARQAELKRKADADAKKAEDKRQELARQDAKRKQDEASGRQKVSDILKKDLEKQRLADMQKSAEQQRQDLARFQAEFGKPKTAECHLMIIAYGRSDPKTQACLVKEQQNTRPPVDFPAPPSALTTGPTNAQLDYLRRNSVSLGAVPNSQSPGLQLEQRQIGTLTSGIQGTPSVGSPAGARQNWTGFRPPSQNLPIDRQTARDNLRYGVFARDSYRTDVRSGQASPIAGFVREDIKSGAYGFSASVYRNKATNEVVIAYRGTESRTAGDLSTDVYARFWRPGMPVPTQYRLARQFADDVRATCKPPCKLTLTGHSLGGALAGYAGRSADNVVTFNAARNALSATGRNQNQLNIVVAGDPIGDGVASAASARAFGQGSLPGRTVTVQTSSPNLLIGDLAAPDGSNPWFGVNNTHPLDGMLGGLYDAHR